MIEARTIVARLLVALALIVQIVAPARASVAMIAAATDPLLAVSVCGHDLSAPEDLSLGVDACRLCDLVCHGAGFAPTPEAPVIARPAPLVVAEVTPSDPARIDTGTTIAGFSARGPPKTA